jgi:RHS repeat-associated protein
MRKSYTLLRGFWGAGPWRPRSFVYNSFSQLLTASNPESGTIAYSYNDDGTLASKTAPKPNQTSPSVTVTTNYSYDEIHRMTTKSYTDGTTPAIKYIYDGVSLTGCTPSGLTDSNPKPNRTSMCDGAGASAWSHDVMGRILAEQRTTNGAMKTTTYSYNPNGSLATLTYPSGRLITYSYNAAARPTSAVDQAYSINYATAATYAPQGALASLQNGGSLVSTLYFNSRLQPCRISVKSSGTAPTQCSDASNIGNVLDFGYGFNLGSSDNGNVIQIANNRDTTRTQNFTYDALNRIATAYTSGNLWGETFQIDPWSNLNKILVYSGKPQPENLNQMAGNNNRFTGMSYDAAGNLLNDGASTYFYDAENRIQSGAGVTYTYDGDGRRVQKSTGKLYWYGMGSDPLDETDAAGNTNNTSFNEYIFFNGKRIARRDSSSNVFYYFADHLGTSREIVQAGQSSPCYDADFYPFGGERVITNTCPQNYKFTGKERDSESGLDNFGARYYSSAMGRFGSIDSTLITVRHVVNPQKLNLYAYVINNPIGYFDPDGRQEKGLLGKIADAIHIQGSVGVGLGVKFNVSGATVSVEASMRSQLQVSAAGNATVSVVREAGGALELAKGVEFGHKKSTETVTVKDNRALENFETKHDNVTGVKIEGRSGEASQRGVEVLGADVCVLVCVGVSVGIDADKARIAKSAVEQAIRDTIQPTPPPPPPPPPPPSPLQESPDNKRQ